jgi:hypothetical protein
VVDAAKAATCTETGLTEGKHCSVCNTVIVAQETVPALGHQWIAATCKAPKTCEVCGVTEGEAAAHTYGDWETVKEATETEAGERKKTCTVCGDTVTEVIPMLTPSVTPEPEGLPLGVIIAIAVAAAVVLGGGAFLLVFYLKKKKML